MKKDRALEYLKKFPEIPEEIMQQARRIHTPYILFDHKDNAFCTHCEEEFSPSIEDIETKHKAMIKCPICYEDAQAIDITKNYKGYQVADIANAIIYLAGDDGNLYIRCFRQTMTFMHGQLRPIRKTIETQRYMFSPEGVARYGIVHDWSNGYEFPYKWVVNAKFNYPNFHDTGLGRFYNYSRDEVNVQAYKQTWLNRSCADIMADKVWLGDYLRFYIRHQGAERLIKLGFSNDIKNMINRCSIALNKIDWKQSEVTKMLGINRAELKYIREKSKRLDDYYLIKSTFPEYPLPVADEYFHALGGYQVHINEVLNRIGRNNTPKLVKYHKKQGQNNLHLYKDYIAFCDQLRYDLTSKEILFPPHLEAAHDRAYAATEAKKIRANNKKLKELVKVRKKLEFEWGDFFIRQPENAEEIITEGRVLRTCVGGYAARHCNGATTIMFVRKKDEPDKPFFTIEIDNNLRIVQCHGYRNDVYNKKPESIIELERNYKDYLENRVAKKFKKLQIGA